MTYYLVDNYNNSEYNAVLSHCPIYITNLQLP